MDTVRALTVGVPVGLKLYNALCTTFLHTLRNKLYRLLLSEKICDSKKYGFLFVHTVRLNEMYNNKNVFVGIK